MLQKAVNVGSSRRERRENRSVITRFAVSFLVTAMARGHAQTTGPAVPPAVARVIVGLEQSGAGSAVPVQKAAVSLFFSEPLTARFRTWGDVRLSSIAIDVQSSTLVTLPGDAGKIAAAVPISELVRSGEFLVGIGYQLLGAQNAWSSLSLIASEGAAMPLVPSKDRFYRQFYGGMRVESAQHTHVVDVAFGQNEAITGGGLRGTVLRFDSFYAFPLTPGNFLYMFGTAMVRASPRGPGAGGHDSYRIGVGVEFFQMLKALRTN
jgi:hypothetical protein